VKPAAFDYYAPDTLDEALAVLAERGDAAKILAGGQIDAERLVTGHITVLPLDTLADLLEGAIRRAGRSAELHDGHTAYSGDIALDQVSPQICHEVPPPSIRIDFRSDAGDLKAKISFQS